MSAARDLDIENAARLRADFLLYCKYFFPIITGRQLIISKPPGRRSHFIVIAEDLQNVALHPAQRVMYNMPPGYGKSTLVVLWVTWCWANWPRAFFMYLSYSVKIASKQTEMIRNIVMLKEYRDLFGITIDKDMRGKERFRNSFGGEVMAAGSAGTITGFDAGLPGLQEFSGALIYDDAHKADEVTSDTIREGVKDNYKSVVSTRVRGINVPVLYIGHMLHEADLPSWLMEGGDGYAWRRISLPALDEADNPLYPEKDTREALHIMREVNEYVFWSQYQQNPIPAGGALYKKEHFILLDNEPKFICTFVTADTAETDKLVNDASVFSFWGLYKIDGVEDRYGLHWIDCYEIRVQPYELEQEFLGFWGRCNRHKTPPQFVALERKSTGVTLLSVLDKMRGLQIRPIERNGYQDHKVNSKTERFLNMQYFVASKLVSLPSQAEHTDSTLSHMLKITANDTHAHDDRADTLYDAIKIAFIDKTLVREANPQGQKVQQELAYHLRQQITARDKSYFGNQRRI